MNGDPILNKVYDVIVVGGGAAGLMAAASSARHGRSVLLLEKNKKFGVKILMSGGTRCNITHNCDSRDIVKAFGRGGKFLHSALSVMPPDQVVELFESLGVATKVESTGKVFPVSNRAIDVRDALVGFAESEGAALRNLSPVQGISKNNEVFHVQTSAGQVQASSIVVTTGGLSFPGCGTTGDGYPWAESFGHSIVDTVPALTPLLSNCDWANDLKGITIDPTEVSIKGPASAGGKKQKPLAQTAGSFLFTHFGFSGPAAMDVSREVARHPNRKELRLVCDFLPSVGQQQVADRLQKAKKEDGGRSVLRVILELWPEFPRRLVESWLEEANVDGSLRLAELSSGQLNAFVAQIKQSAFSLQGTLGYEKAEVTAGGVCLKEVNSSTMESKLCPGLHFAGEILDLDGPIGGYNFQAAWSTGWLAGMNA